MRFKKKKSLLILTSCMLLSLFVGMSVSDKTNVARAEENVLTKTFDFKFKTSGSNNKYVGDTDPGADYWTSSYAKHTINYDIGVVEFESANAQSNTITDMPVTKGNYVSLVMKKGYTIKSIKLNAKKWSSKNQTITLNTSTDYGTNYTKTSITSTSFAIPENSIDANAIKFTFSSASNQVGISSLTIKYVYVTPSISITTNTNEIFLYDDKSSIDATLTYNVSNIDNPNVMWEVTNNEENIVEYIEEGNNLYVFPVNAGEVKIKAKLKLENEFAVSQEITIKSYLVTTLSKPTNIGFENTTKTLTWNSVEHADYYEISYFDSDENIKSINATTNLYQFTSLKSGNYDFYIKACSNSKQYKNSAEAEASGIEITNTLEQDFKLSETEMSLSFDYNDNSNTSYYSLVTKLEDININDTFIIGCSYKSSASLSENDSFVLMNTRQKPNNRKSVKLNSLPKNGIIEQSDISSDVQKFKIIQGSQDKTYSFETINNYINVDSNETSETISNETGYLSATTVGEKNYLRTTNVVDNLSSWEISSIDNNGGASIINKGRNDRNHLRFNSISGNEIFSCYSEKSCVIVSLYKLVEENFSDFNNVSMKFRYSFDNMSDSKITSTGLIVSQTNLFIDPSLTSDKAIYDKYTSIDKTRVFENTEKKTQYVVRLLDIPAIEYNTEITTVGYVEIDGNVYLNKPKTYSVKTLLNYYATNENYVDSLLSYEDGASFKVQDIAKAFLDSIK